MAEGRVHLTTFLEGVVVHGGRTPFVLLAPSPHAPHHGLLMPIQVPWSPGFLPTTLLSSQLETSWGIPCRFVDKSMLPVIFDERTSRLPTPWLLRVEGLEGQQRLYLTHLLLARAPEDLLPQPPPGGQWFNEKGLQSAELLPGIRRLCQAALQAVMEG